MTQHQEKIEKIVSEYKRLFPGEYSAVCEQIARGRKELHDDDFGTLNPKSQNDVLDRKLHEIPATLFTMFEQALTPEAFTYLFSDADKKGARWFARKFREFAIPKKI